MTTNNGAGGLVAKWREIARGERVYDATLDACADELEAALQAPGEAVPCKTVIVYGDHGPEEREPVEEYYEAPPPKPAGGAVAWLYRYPHDGESDHCISPVRFLPSWGSAKNATETPLFTTPPPDDVLRRVVEEMRDALVVIAGGGLSSLTLAKIAKDALAAAHKALAEGVDRGS